MERPAHRPSVSSFEQFHQHTLVAPSTLRSTHLSDMIGLVPVASASFAIGAKVAGCDCHGSGAASY